MLKLIMAASTVFIFTLVIASLFTQNEFLSGCHPHDHFYLVGDSLANGDIANHVAHGYNATYIKDVENKGYEYRLYHMSC